MPTDSAVSQLSNSPIFSGTSKVYGRVSHKGGKANPADNQPSLRSSISNHHR